MSTGKIEYETVIGLEVHAQLKTESKIFCRCSTEFGKGPNDNTCPVCLGLPGVLPVLNRKVVEFAILAGLATNCKIRERSVFARKNYFYPDLPKGYQISQYELPLCEDGWIEIDSKKIGITRVHLEEDAGKLLHEHPETRATDASWVDLNRAGVPLVEIVSEPDIRSPEEAVLYLKKLRGIVCYLGVCDGNMEEGSLRCDANISLRPSGQKEFGTKAELKNMNSFKNVERAIRYEEERQRQILEEGGKIVQETRLWNADKGVTESMRSKEEAHDYRYFPDPDLLPLRISPSLIEKMRGALPEFQDTKKRRIMEAYGLAGGDLETLTQSRELADFFEETVKSGADPKKACNWILTELLRELKGVSASKLKPKQLAELLSLIDNGTISGKMAKDIFPKICATGKDPGVIIREEGLGQISGAGALEPVVDEVITANSKEVERYKSGQVQLMAFFVGQVMKRTKGQANPKEVNELLQKKLKL